MKAFRSMAYVQSRVILFYPCLHGFKTFKFCIHLPQILNHFNDVFEKVIYK